MQTEKDPPTNPTYEYLKNLSSDELREVDASTLPPRLLAYLVGRLEQSTLDDIEWSDMFMVQMEKTDTERVLENQALEDVKTEQADKQRIIKYQKLKKTALNYKSTDRTLGELFYYLFLSLFN